MVRALPILVLLACTIYTVVYIVQTNSERVRRLPKTLWLLVTILVPGLGVVAWWIFGRPSNVPVVPPTAPDDDTDFLRSL